ncbi:MAG: translocation/assembly module TamB domain-containing protein, partial [Candidatus Babeliales bacterium]
FQDIMYKNYKLLRLCSIGITKKNNLWSGSCYAHTPTSLQIKSDFCYNMETLSGIIDIHNHTPFRIPGTHYWYIQPKAASIKIAFDQHQSEINCEAFATHKSIPNACITTNLGGKLDKSEFSLNGLLGTYQCEAFLSRPPTSEKRILMIKDKDNHPVLTCTHSAQTNVFTLTTHMKLIQELAKLWKLQLQGTGELITTLTPHHSHLLGKVHFQQGIIRLPKTYNCIRNGTAHFDFNMETLNLLLHTIICNLYKGTVRCHHGTIQFAHDGTINKCSLPFFIDSFLFNSANDILALLSGKIVCTKNKQMPLLCSGVISIEQSYINENIFSPAFQTNIVSVCQSRTPSVPSDVQCNITITTDNPTKIKTEFLETEAAISLQVSNTLRDPLLSGKIQLLSGALLFPYKPLYIVTSFIQCQPEDIHNPYIDIVAKNTVKKYTITLHVTGRLRNHTITLSSVPELTQEQIISLLLVGSEEKSLNIVMPALIINNLANLLFTSDHSPINLDYYFSNLLKPLQNVHLVPSFSDQTGRGGLRGTLEIDVNEQLRALIQKNFSLSEDTRFELEYTPTDSIRVRGIRTERKDIGAEIEMIFKFLG